LVLALATVRSIGSKPVGIGVLDGTKLIAVAVIDGCEVVCSDNFPTISMASANVKGISGWSFICMRGEAII
jgi:hypothetical protein